MQNFDWLPTTQKPEALKQDVGYVVWCTAANIRATTNSETVLRNIAKRLLSCPSWHADNNFSSLHGMLIATSRAYMSRQSSQEVCASARSTPDLPCTVDDFPLVGFLVWRL